MNRIWNEDYLEKNKLVEPVYLEHWLKGLDHLVATLKLARLWVVLILLLIAVHCYVSDIGQFTRADRAFNVGIGLLSTFVAHPLILSYWSHLKNKNFEYKLSFKTVFMMMLVTFVYFVLAGLFLLFLIVPGLWFMITFSLSMIILAVENTEFLKSFSLSKELVSGHFSTAAKFLTLWPALLILLFFLVEYALMVAPGIVLSLSGLELPFSIYIFIDDVINLLFQLSMLPPVVYLFAYLTDRRLHKGS